MILLFLGSWRSTLIIAISIPLSILSSIIVLSAMGETMNTMTLGGLALAIGILVDDATVTIENIHRHMGSQSLKEAVLIGASEIATPTLVSTLTICIVFVSVVFLTGPAKPSLYPRRSCSRLCHVGVVYFVENAGSCPGELPARSRAHLRKSISLDSQLLRRSVLSSGRINDRFNQGYFLGSGSLHASAADFSASSQVCAHCVDCHDGHGICAAAVRRQRFLSRRGFRPDPLTRKGRTRNSHRNHQSSLQPGRRSDPEDHPCK